MSTLPPRPLRALQGQLRIAHCGGFHIQPLNQLIKAINLVAKLLHKWAGGQGGGWANEQGCVCAVSRYGGQAAAQVGGRGLWCAL